MATGTAGATTSGAGRTLALCFAAALCEGYDLQSMGVAAPGLAATLHLTRDQLGPAFSASTLGLLIGAILIGRLADRIGRRWCLTGALAVFGIFSAATILAWTFPSLIALRLIAGLGLGGSMPNIVALAAESARADRRARLVMVMGSGMAFGAAVAGAIAIGLDWRGVFLVGGAAPILLALAMSAALPESRRFVEARTARSGAGPAAVRQILLGEGRAATTLLLWIASFATLLTLYVLINWLPTLMAARGVGRREASLVSLMFNLGGGVGVLILAVLIDAGHQRRSLAGLFVGAAASLVVLAGAGSNWVLAAIVSFAVGVFVSCPPLALYALAAGYYRTAMRGTGVGTTVAVGRLGAIAGPLLAAFLLARGSGPAGVLIGLLPLVIVAAAASLALPARVSAD